MRFWNGKQDIALLGSELAFNIALPLSRSPFDYMANLLEG